MQIADQTVVSLQFTLTDDDGDVLDSSPDGEPLVYLHGAGSIIPGLETALAGRVPGDAFQVTIAPEDGYGEHDPALLHVTTRAQFADASGIEIGMQFQAGDEDDVETVTVVAVEGDRITLDANHPLAGMTLHFEVEVVAVRAATAEEIAHGHLHGEDDEHH